MSVQALQIIPVFSILRTWGRWASFASAVIRGVVCTQLLDVVWMVVSIVLAYVWNARFDPLEVLEQRLQTYCNLLGSFVLRRNVFARLRARLPRSHHADSSACFRIGVEDGRPEECTFNCVVLSSSVSRMRFRISAGA